MPTAALRTTVGRLRAFGADVLRLHAEVGRDFKAHAAYLYRRHRSRRANRFQRHPILDAITAALLPGPRLPSTRDAAPIRLLYDPDTSTHHRAQPHQQPARTPPTRTSPATLRPDSRDRSASAEPQRTTATTPSADAPAKQRPVHPSVRERLADAIAKGCPDGKPWTNRTLAAAVGCAPSTAGAFLQDHRRHQQPTRQPAPSRSQRAHPPTSRPSEQRQHRSREQ